MKYEFHLHEPLAAQREALARSWDKRNFALLMEAGTGKSFICIHNAAILFERGLIDTFIVIAPKNAPYVWYDEQIPMELPPRIKRRMGMLQGAYIRKPDIALCRNPAPRGELRVLVFGMGAFSKAGGKGVELCAQALHNARGSFVVIDESHNISTPGAKRTRKLRFLGEKATYKRILTGTPTDGRYEDLDPQFRFLDWRIIGCKTAAAFRAEYCYMRTLPDAQGNKGEDRPKLITGYKNVAELHKKLAPYVYVKRLADMTDLPPLRLLERKVILSPEQKKHYQELKLEYMTTLPSGTVVEADLAIQRITRLRQVLSGFVGTKDELLELPCPRFDDVIEFLREFDMHTKTLLWVNYRPEAHRLQQLLHEADIPAVGYHGGYSSEACDRMKTKFQQDPAIRCMVVSYSKGSESMTVNESTASLFVSHTFSYKQWFQATRRNYRLGQTAPVTHWDYRVPGSIDDRLLKVRADKKDVAEVLSDPATFAKWLEQDEI